MTLKSDYTASELLAILSARQLKDGRSCSPASAFRCSRRRWRSACIVPASPSCSRVASIGAFIEPGKLPPSTNDQRCTARANMVLGSADVLLLLQRGYVDVGFMGGAQIDQYGNFNSSFIGDPENPKTRLPGTGGGNDIASLTNMIVAMKHERSAGSSRTSISSPAPAGSTAADAAARAASRRRHAAGYHRTCAVWFRRTTRRMKPLALNPGVTREQVQENTGFKLDFDADVGVTEPPTEHELSVLRTLDPERLYIG